MTDCVTAHWYKIFGLTVCSEFALPEASAMENSPAETCDAVQIRRGSVPLSLSDGLQLADWMEVSRERCLYRFKDVCRMSVASGREIVVDQFPGVPDSDVRAFLFGSGLGTIVHQRKLVPLHISAVQSPGGTIAFTGPSGAGKSTVVAALARFNGWSVICDDLAVLDPSDDELFLHAGVRRKKLWRDAIEALGLGQQDMDPDLGRLDKFHLHIERETGVGAPPIQRLYQLSWGRSNAIREISPSGRFTLAMNSIYRPYLTPVLNDVSVVRDVAIALSREIRAFELERPRRLEDLRVVSAAIVEHCGQA